MFTMVSKRCQHAHVLLNEIGAWVGPLVLRVLLAVEFWPSGVKKWSGSNWFNDIQDRFPFPLNHVPANVSWSLATGFELAGAIALVFGVGTRFFSVSLSILTGVAIAAVHWPDQWDSLSELTMGYVISDNGYGNYKLPLIYLVMFVPLILQGAGKFSLDYWLGRRLILGLRRGLNSY
ncbi:DoxX family protein [Burkholderia ubonensis]|uniref:DoxX family protein n=1 Tax=Burkholderia ubonensis TaxID=101571 RepID=A0A106QEN8_9BURK|nr:DoxX family protein [Burkholderia ubonensis]KWA84819.1 DoxX family protein [Burkholderia ubonensis]KWB91968.1 DoxX family protein [Burkholderia ubonensis]KWZ58577.1 DoxX family protein [Burkholderia ubonensis]